MDALGDAYRHVLHDPGIAALAARQHGVVSSAQLAQLGFDRSAIQRRVRAGRLHRVHRGVYAVGHPSLSALGRCFAAVLACGPDAALSHRSAAALWGWRRHDGRPEVTVRRTGARSRRGVVVHVSRTLDARAITRRHGIPVTTPERTIVDLADVLRPDDLARTVSAAERAGHLDRERLWVPPGRRNPVRAPHVWTRSGFERRFRAAVREWHLPEPRLNHHVAGWEVDCVWPEHRFAVELDHPHTHLNPESFESDPLKAEAVMDAGFTLRRVTERRFARHPGDVRAMLARHLGGELHGSRG